MCYKCSVTLDDIRQSVLRTSQDSRQCERRWLDQAEQPPAGTPPRQWRDHCQNQAAWWRHRRSEALGEYRLWRDIKAAARRKDEERRCGSCGAGMRF